MNNTIVGIERIIAKIDNDFNLDNSDWIPRVGAWCIDAMSQLNVLNKVTKTKRLEVKNRIAINNCDITDDDLKVYDENGCEIDAADKSSCGCETSLTGEQETPYENDCNTNGARTLEMGVERNEHYHSMAMTTNDYRPEHWTEVHTIKLGTPRKGSDKRTYVKIDNRRIELNFDAKYITIKNKEIETKYSSTYGIELPVIPDNGLLLEALAYYCMYKFLLRGYKHPVFNLSASQYGTNPYYEWSKLKDQAKRSVLNDKFDYDTASFRSYFFDSTFPK